MVVSSAIFGKIFRVGIPMNTKNTFSPIVKKINELRVRVRYSRRAPFFKCSILCTISMEVIGKKKKKLLL